MADPRRSETLKDRLIRLSDRSGNCWLMRGYLQRNGYSRIKFKGSIISAHRASYIEFLGNIPNGQSVLHKCDTRNCINPDHLFLGSHQDNMDDMVFKKRSTYGSKNYKSILDESMIDGIFDSYLSGESSSSISRRLGVSKSTIIRVLKRDLWQNVFIQEDKILKASQKMICQKSGGDHPQSKLSNKDREDVINSYLSKSKNMYELKDFYGVSVGCIFKIIKKYRMKHGIHVS